MGALWAGNLYRGFTVGNCILVHYLKIFRAKDVSTDREKRVVVQNLHRWLARTRAIELYTEILRPRLATNPERVFFKH